MRKRTRNSWLWTLALAFLLLAAGCENHEWTLPPEFPPVTPRYYYFDPAWSPTGEHIAYGRGIDPTDTLDAWGLHVYDTVDSTSVWLIESNPPLPGQFGRG